MDLENSYDYSPDYIGDYKPKFLFLVVSYFRSDLLEQTLQLKPKVGLRI